MIQNRLHNETDLSFRPLVNIGLGFLLIGSFNFMMIQMGIFPRESLIIVEELTKQTSGQITAMFSNLVKN